MAKRFSVLFIQHKDRFLEDKFEGAKGLHKAGLRKMELHKTGFWLPGTPFRLVYGLPWRI